MLERVEVGRGRGGWRRGGVETRRSGKEGEWRGGGVEEGRKVGVERREGRWGWRGGKEGGEWRGGGVFRREGGGRRVVERKVRVERRMGWRGRE